ncbi:unnamed protein product, partial [Urochloa humidicola]
VLVAARAPELRDCATELWVRDVAALLGPSLDGGRGGPTRRTGAKPEEAPRDDAVVADRGGGGSGGAGRRREGFRVWCARGEEEEAGEARAARGSGHRPWAKFELAKAGIESFH